MKLSVLSTLFGSLIAASVESGSIYLPPIKGTKKLGADHCIIIIQGASIQTGRYVPIAQAIQRSVPVPLHIAIPNFLLDLPLPIVNIHDAISKVSLNFPDDCPLVLVGHSVGISL